MHHDINIVSEVQHTKKRMPQNFPDAPLGVGVVSSDGASVSSPDAVVSCPEGVVSSPAVVVVVSGMILVVVVDSVAIDVSGDVVVSPGALVVDVVSDGESLDGPATAEQTPDGNSSRAKMRWLLRPIDICCSITWNCSVMGSKYRISGKYSKIRLNHKSI